MVATRAGRAMPSLFAESEAHTQGFGAVCGVDEAGRGPLAGPVVAAAVVLTPGALVEGVADSKLLGPAAREHLYGVLHSCAVSISVGVASAQEVDLLNILGATHAAMRRAVEGLRPAADFAIVDGLAVPDLGLPHRAVIGGDRLCHSVAAASIIAKVTRDRLMVEMDALYPGYGFSKHKGYGTREHVEAITRLGRCSIHRMSFRVPSERSGLGGGG